MSPDRHARTLLPIPDVSAPELMTVDARDPATTLPPIEPLHPSIGAPDVLVALLDDVAFGAPFGDETIDIGHESGTTATGDDSARDSRLTGRIHWVRLDTDIDDHDRFIDPEERLRVAMARQ